MYIKEFVLRDDLEIHVSILIDDYEFIKNHPTEENILKKIKETFGFIEFVGNPTYNVQLEAIVEYPFHIKYIENPYIDIQKLAVRSRPDLICYIKNPTEEVQLISINKYWGNINFIKNPSKKIQIEAVKNINFKYDKGDRSAIIALKITCKEAIDLYYKLLKVSKIII